MRVFENITKTVGNTPLVKFQRIGKDLPAEILLKLEFFNPLGSVKDRVGLSMIERAELTGELKPGMRIIEPTSGNTGIALAFVCAAKGYSLTLVMPETMSQERRVLLLLFGAEIVLTPGPLGMKGAIAKALELRDRFPGSFIPGQFENSANPEIHRETTALEIWRDTDGLVDIVVSGVGTGGTITGIGEVLKSKKAGIEMVAVEPEESSVISSQKAGSHQIQGIGAGFIPKILNLKIIDQVERVSSSDALEIARKVIRQEGIPCGISSGAAIVGALRVAAKPENKGKVIVVILASYAERYLSTLLAEKERKDAAALGVSGVEERWLDLVSK